MGFDFLKEVSPTVTAVLSRLPDAVNCIKIIHCPYMQMAISEMIKTVKSNKVFIDSLPIP